MANNNSKSSTNRNRSHLRWAFMGLTIALLLITSSSQITLERRQQALATRPSSSGSTTTQFENDSSSNIIPSSKTSPLHCVKGVLLPIITHPYILLLDVALVVLCQGTVAPALRSLVMASKRSSPIVLRHLRKLPWRKASPAKMVALVKSFGKNLQRLYKNRGRISVLSDYTWYVNASSSSEEDEYANDDENVE
jgi:hypothetical protein